MYYIFLMLTMMVHSEIKVSAGTTSTALPPLPSPFSLLPRHRHCLRVSLDCLILAVASLFPLKIQRKLTLGIFCARERAVSLSSLHWFQKPKIVQFSLQYDTNILSYEPMSVVIKSREVGDYSCRCGCSRFALCCIVISKCAYYQPSVISVGSWQSPSSN
jgi:hypothetical protein